MKWKEKRVLILGAARQGTALAAYLAALGAKVVLSDMRDSNHFTEAQQKLEKFKISWRFGEQKASLLNKIEFLSVSGGISPDIPLVREAKKRNIKIINDSQVFMEAAPCPVIGITGSAGKTTTTILVGRILSAMKKKGKGKVWVGGNLGNPLISSLGEMHFEDLAIVELSSFQLELMDISPSIAVLLNLAPNHLDRHLTMSDYVAAKARILDFQKQDNIAVLAREDFGSHSLANRVQGELWTFGREQLEDHHLGSYLSGNDIWVRNSLGDHKVMSVSLIALRGEHNLLNVLAACCIASAIGATKEDMRLGIEGFPGAPHRLEFVRSLNGVDWYNDSIATSPQRSEAALQSFDRPIVLLAGGRDKGLSWEKFAALAGIKTRKVLAFGEAAPLVQSVFTKINGKDIEVEVYPKLLAAVEAASQFAAEGDVVLLAPGGTSFDEFHDFEARGQRFRELVNQL